jgi:DUF4097 and DUF4098 domain-containing protein YvlB
MKTTVFILIIFANSLFAQRIVEKEFVVSPDQKIVLEFDFADQINVSTWDKSSVYIRVSVNINEGSGNDKFELFDTKAKHRLFVESKIKDLDKLAGECSTIIIEDGDTTFINGRRTQMDIDFEVIIPKGTQLSMESINGDIVLKGLTAPLEISTINGDIDLFIKEDQKADLSMETINGTMYTNLEMKILKEKEGLCRIRGNVESQLNGGGPEINLSTINGTMYLRKQN